MANAIRSLKTALQVPFLRNILLITLFSAALVPLYGLFVSHPQYEQLLVSITEDEAARLARHLSQILHEEGADIAQDRLPQGFAADILAVKSDFKLVKVKVFSAEGVVVYSTATQDIGKANEHAYFKEIVAQGRVFSKVVKKNIQTAEGQVMDADVVETYQPIMHQGRFLGAFELYYDITDRVTRMDRLLFRERLDRSLKAARRTTDKRTAVLYLDLDKFKAVNDTYGHTTGDALLQEVARRLSEAVREVDTVARLGGDEFAVVLHEVADSDAPQRVADKIIAAVNEPVFVEGHHCHVGTSIGIALAPDHAEEAAALVDLADAAMYAAKKNGRNCYAVHGDGCASPSS
jgi:diguanylate cyclase (GGDEF)-like protein